MIGGNFEGFTDVVVHGCEMPVGGLEVRVEGVEVEGFERVGVGVFLYLLAPGDGVAAKELGCWRDVCGCLAQFGRKKKKRKGK